MPAEPSGHGTYECKEVRSWIEGKVEVTCSPESGPSEVRVSGYTEAVEEAEHAQEPVHRGTDRRDPEAS